jgi:two-component system, NtrC family, nitrogen regulation sensor histidine kinase NtrY
VQQLPRLFRRRLFVVMLAAGLLPVAAWGALGQAALERFLSFSFERLQSVLGRADAELQKTGAGDAGLRDELRQAQLNLGQVELARRSLLRRAPWAFAALALLSTLLFAVAAQRLGRRIATPIEQLAQGMQRQAAGEHEHRVAESEARRPDELQFLVRRFNAMSDELQQQRRRLQLTEKLLAWQEVARALAHELKNPLTAMRMAAARMARSPSPELQEPLQLLQEEIDVLIRMTQSFSSFAALPPPRPRPLDLRQLLEEVCALYRHDAPVELLFAPGPPVTVDADPDQLRRAFSNLVKNALEASRPGGGPVQLRVVAEPARVRVEIDDAGSGIGEALDDAAMAVGRKSEKPGGSGLGLPICQKIVHEHGGTLRLDPLPQAGTRALVTLPLFPPS